METLHAEDPAAEEILIGCFVERQSIKKVGGRRSVEELYQALFFVSPFAPNVSPSETKIEPDHRLIKNQSRKRKLMSMNQSRSYRERRRI